MDLDVTVDVDAGDLPRAVHKGLRRQGPQVRLIKPLKERPPARPVLPHLSGIERGAELRDPGVEDLQGEKLLVPQPGEDPSLDDLDPDLGLGFVAGSVGAGWERYRPVVLEEFLVRPL
jgi:hypothetical protein